MLSTAVFLAAQTSGEPMDIGDAAVTAIFGYCVVFVGLIILMGLLYATGAYFKSKDAKAAAAAKTALENTAKKVEENPLKVIAAEPEKAPGSAGHVKLYNVPDKEAAMIMAIVADKMQKPINELHFISIKEVK